MLFRFKRNSYRLKHRGAIFIEYALILAFVIVAGLIFINGSHSDGIASIFNSADKTLGKAAGTYRNFTSVDLDKITLAIKNSETLIKQDSSNLGGKVNVTRGFVRDAWPTTTDKTLVEEINAALAGDGLSLEALGATYWTFYNGENVGNKSKYPADTNGLYWTDQELNSADFTKNPAAISGSNEKIDYYFYSTSEKKFYAVNGEVWMPQPDNPQRLTLASWRQEWNKAEATRTGPYDSLDELKASLKK